VFCRVRPLLPDDGGRQEASVIAYPTSTESLGRGIDVVQSGKFSNPPYYFAQLGYVCTRV